MTALLAPSIAQPSAERADAIQRQLEQAAAAEQSGQIVAASALIAALGSAIDDRPDGLHLAGLIATRANRYADAAGYMERALEGAVAAGASSATRALIHRNLIEVYRRLSRYDEALAAAEASLELNPDDPITFNNLGVALSNSLDDESAIAAFDRAIALDPAHAGSRLGRGEIRLARGDYAQGWADYDWRFRLPGVTPPVPPELVAQNGARAWDGSDTRGTLLLAADQGFGDVIQFARYLPWVAQRCGRLIVAASTEMHPVIAQFPEVAELAAAWDKLGPFGAWATFSDLPKLAGTRFDTIPANTPYLTAESELVARWRQRLDQMVAPGLRRVGLVWAGRPSHSNDFARSVALSQLTAFAKQPGVTWVSLQKGEQQREIGGYFGHTPLINIGSEIADYADTMAVIATLDLVVTVDTSVAHLAGAMNKPVWIMLPYRADWRWGRRRPDTPWYKSARLFRQSAPMLWESLANSVSKSLISRIYDTDNCI